MNIFRGGIFKQIGFLLSSPQAAQMIVYIPNSGIVSQELLPHDTGFASSTKEEKEWAGIHSLKFQVRKNGEPVQDESVLVVTDRNYLPLDPFDTLKPKDRERMASLTDIARLRHAQARSKAGKAVDPKARVTEFIIHASFVMLGVFAFITWMQGC